METTASDYFGAMVAEYDSLIRRCVPRYAEMTDELIAYLPERCERVLELGCGTGNLTLEIARHRPGARLTVVDAAPAMVDVTRARLAKLSPESAGRASYVVSTFETLALAPGSFDVVTSYISLHHVVDKRALYRRIHEWLRPGGTLCFADQMLGATSEIHARNWSQWLAFCRAPEHCSQAEVQSLLDHAAAHDHYTPVQEHFRLMAGADFRAETMDCVWRHLIWGVVSARR